MQILVLYYSRTGNTKELAGKIAEGASEVEGVKVLLKSVSEVTKEDFIESQGGFDLQFIEDEFDPELINREFSESKKGQGTRCVSALQIDGNIVFEWWFLKITRRPNSDKI